mmetsp:Transcript_35366/g.80253  ORF Transcript_35366/g.80253 Transcript_35366/m.80253 type:complete len:226 (-) Transcript_35366:220-897(-)
MPTRHVSIPCAKHTAPRCLQKMGGYSTSQHPAAPAAARSRAGGRGACSSGVRRPGGARPPECGQDTGAPPPTRPRCRSQSRPSLATSPSVRSWMSPPARRCCRRRHRPPRRRHCESGAHAPCSLPRHTYSTRPARCTAHTPLTNQRLPNRRRVPPRRCTRRERPPGARNRPGRGVTRGPTAPPPQRASHRARRRRGALGARGPHGSPQADARNDQSAHGRQSQRP